ncbi:MAG: dual specificity protein phosphatase family protein [Cellulomonadaceae bacterium]|nr:dual specificity protein phosphatase family protein [Cellulomonadaceae bacterium]
MASRSTAAPNKRLPLHRPAPQPTRANLTWLTDTLATGGDFEYDPVLAAEQVEDLLAQQVGVIIDCRIEADDGDIWAQYPEIEYHHLPEDDYGGHKMSANHFAKAVSIARAAHAQGKKVLAHCHMGINRGPSTAFAILLDRGFSAAEAFDLIRAKRPISAVYYAEDALVAHLNRQGVDPAPELAKFRAHHDQVFTPTEIAQIAHTIRQTHQARGDL